MIYDSVTGMSTHQNGYPLMTTAGERIHIGGDPDPDQAGISSLDIERDVELYPTHPIDSRSAPERSHSTNVELDSVPLTKRWWSVQEDHDAPPNAAQPWPPAADGSRTITYCFQNQRVFDELSPLFTRALDKWAVVARVSSLQFAPDAACRQVPCLCDTPHVADVSLRIMQAPQGQPLLHGAVSTLGYRTHDLPQLGQMPRHFLLWSANTDFFRTPSLGGLMIAHELGERTRPKPSKKVTEAKLSQDISSGSHTNINDPTQAAA